MQTAFYFDIFMIIIDKDDIYDRGDDFGKEIINWKEHCFIL